MQLRPFQSTIKIILISRLLNLLCIHSKALINKLTDSEHKPTLGIHTRKETTDTTKTNIINNRFLIKDLTISNNRITYY